MYRGRVLRAPYPNPHPRQGLPPLDPAFVLLYGLVYP